MVVGTMGRLTVNHHPMKGCLHRRPPSRWFCHGTLIVLLFAANIRFVPRAMILHDHSMKTATTTTTATSTASLDGTQKEPLSGNRRTDPPEDTFCQTIQDAHEFLEPAPHEPRRNMAHVFVVNSGHLPLLRNALVSIRSLPTAWKSIVLAMDDKLCPSLYEQSSSLPELKQPLCIDYAPRLIHQLKRDEPLYYQLYLDPVGRKPHQRVTLDRTARWGTVRHRILMNSKLYGLRDILQCGLDAFLTDADLVFLKDPRPYFRVGEDIMAQPDLNPSQYQMDINSGFMYWRHTPQNLILSQALIREPLSLVAIDQTRVNDLLFARGINVTLLPSHQFPSGAILYRKDNVTNNVIPLSNETVAAHANWNTYLDQKKDILAQHGLWLIPTEG